MQALAVVLAEIEAAQPLDALLVACGDAVEIVLHARGEAVVDEPPEVLLEQRDDGEREERRNERRPLLEDVAPVEDRAEDRCVRRGAADAELLERAHERRLGVARRRVRLVSLRLELLELDRVALRHVRQAAFVVFALGHALVRVAALLVGGEEAAECDHRAGGAELRLLARRGGAGDAERDGLAGGVLHLRGDRADPDQLVQRELVTVQLACQLLRRSKRVAGRPDRLMRLLRVLHLALVAARLLRDVLVAVQLARLAASGGERRLRQRRRVGAHVRDVAVLVEALGESHRRLGREAELAARVLLQGRRHERRARAADVRLPLDAGDPERGAFEPFDEPASRFAVELVCFAAKLSVRPEVSAGRHALRVHGDETGLERIRIEGCEEIPPLGGAEGHPLALALDDEPRCDRLDAAGG